MLGSFKVNISLEKKRFKRFNEVISINLDEKVKYTFIWESFVCIIKLTYYDEGPKVYF